MADEPAEGESISLNHAREQTLEADSLSDNDSALGDDTQSTTTSLSESIYNYRQEHGRTYHSYKDGQYVFPNDEREQDRLDLQHHMCNLTYRRLHLAPLEKPRHALDIGTGTGIWAMDFADQYPECQVIGIDLSPSQPTFVPPNLKYIIDDAEELWVSVDNTLDGTSLEKWGILMCEAARKLGRPMGTEVSEKYRKWMEAAGFVNIEEQHFMWPSNAWPKDKYMKELGNWNMINILEGLEGFCLALMTRGLGWTKEEVDVFVAKVSADVKNRGIHAYYPMPVVWGRKPLTAN
ncbi:S-adenosyl-L-methionine-dependent methyltransferase, partial [Aureobasidium melanogenum]